MSDAKISKIEARIAEITARPTYSSTPAWRQEVAEMRIQIEAMRSGKSVERKEYTRLEVGGKKPVVEMAGAAAAETDGHGEEHHANYIGIFLGLAFLTLLEWKAASLFGIHGEILWVVLTVMAVVKALMVAMYFMHLSSERRIIHILLALPVVLVVFMMILVFPDALAHIGDYLNFVR